MKKIILFALSALVLFSANANMCVAQTETSTQHSRELQFKYQLVRYETNDGNGNDRIYLKNSTDIQTTGLFADAESYSTTDRPIARVELNVTAQYLTNGAAEGAEANHSYGGLLGILLGGVSHGRAGEKVIYLVTAKVIPLVSGTFQPYADDLKAIEVEHTTSKSFQVDIETTFGKKSHTVPLELNGGQEQGSSSIRLAMLRQARRAMFAELNRENSEHLASIGAPITPTPASDSAALLTDARRTYRGKRLIVTESAGLHLKVGDRVSVSVTFSGEAGTNTVIANVLHATRNHAELQLDGYDGQEYAVNLEDEIIIVSSK